MPQRTWNLPALRESTRTASEQLLATREVAATPRGEPPAGVTISQLTVGDVDAVLSAPPAANGTVLYFHGGGYRMGAPGGWTAFTGAVALASGARVLAVDYRLAPEHPFPAAVHDAVAVYDALLDGEPLGGDDPGPIVVGGDSAGGGLAFALGVACLDAGVDLPTGIFALSPWADMTITAGTFDSRAETDQFFPKSAAQEAVDTYLQGHDPSHVLASPALADLSEFPPVLLLAGGAETLLDDALTLATVAARAGVSVELHAVAGMQHVWPLLFSDIPETAEAIAAIGRFVDRVIGATA
jgi:monoterpene epsilon-lactone hydrolase